MFCVAKIVKILFFKTQIVDYSRQSHIFQSISAKKMKQNRILIRRSRKDVFATDTFYQGSRFLNWSERIFDVLKRFFQLSAQLILSWQFFPEFSLIFIGKTFFAQRKNFLLSEFFPAKIFSCSERFPFSKIPEKILSGKKLTEQKSFFAEQKRLVHIY